MYKTQDRKNKTKHISKSLFTCARKLHLYVHPSCLTIAHQGYLYIYQQLNFEKL